MSDNRAEVLIVDDEEPIRRSISAVLSSEGFLVDTADSAEAGLSLVHAGKRFDVVVTDLKMPGISGIEFMRQLKQLDPDIAVILLTGHATLETAISTVEHGGFRYLQKPSEVDRLCQTVRDAATARRSAVLKRRALEVWESDAWLARDRGTVEDLFERALDRLFIAFQPIVRWPERQIYGHEALVRSAEPGLANPGLLFDAAERLGRVEELGRKIRAVVALEAACAPSDSTLFVNLHARELADHELFSESAPLSRRARRIVLEITERNSLHRITDIRERIATLRKLGYRIAVDDLGAGYSGLASFSELEPDTVKLDMALIRDVDASPTKASIVRSMISVCTEELGTAVVCEGVETESERDTLQSMGASLLQGHLFALPERGFRTASIFAPAMHP